jgi:uroporphyrinogen-III synthase
MLLITRPIAQTKNLESLLLANEIDYAFFPALEIQKLRPIVLNHKYDVIIFISVNAVNYAEEYFDQLFIDPVQIFAVGPVTAKQLISKNIKVDCYPKKNASSWELLKMKECQALSNKKILIIRGKGGSETLKNNLSFSNQVDYFEVYKRVQCQLTLQHNESLEMFMSYPDGFLMATSEESLVNVMHLVESISSKLIQTLLTKKIIVFSERIRVLAKDFGFTNIEITLNPSDEDLVNLLVDKK